MKSMYNFIYGWLLGPFSGARGDGSKSSPLDLANPIYLRMSRNSDSLGVSLALAQLDKSKKEENVNGVDE